jgi:S-DNA-T family DNA segregation ATPase FtsK/SpoIIIE
MAAPARTRKRTRSKSKSTKQQPSVMIRVPRAIGRALLATVGWARQSPVPEQVKREIVAVGALCFAALLGLSLVGYVGPMTVIGTVGRGLTWIAGRGALFAPIGLVWIAIELLIGSEPPIRRRRLFGLLFFAASIITFLSLIVPEGGRHAGGEIGRTLSDGARFIAGNAGAGIVSFAFGMVGVYLLTGIHAREVVDAWQRTRAARSARASERQSRPSRNPDPPVAPPPEPLRDEETTAQRPVINMPKRQKASEPPPAAAVPPPAPETTVISLVPAPLPEIKKLALYDAAAPESGELESKADLIQETLRNFKVDATVREIFPGPAVTLFALEPGPGTKVRRITELQNDLALALAARSIRIEAPVPGMARVGIELPNVSVHTVGLRETIESVEFQSSKAKLPLALGRDVNGTYIIADLARMPHLLIAGSTGSGKSVCINGIISTFLLNKRPEELQMVLIDPKMVELTGFNGVPHLKCPVVTEMGKVVGTLRLVLKEMEDRYQRFSMLGVRNIDGYNLRRDEDPSLEMLPYLVVIIDELADLMLTTPEEVETLLVRLAQMARATGIHLLIATQRPSVDVLTGLIKANVPARIAFAVTSHTDSRVILDLPGAERLLGRGDMLFLPPDEAKPMRVQGSFIDDKDSQYLVRHWRKQVPNHTFDQEWADVPSAEEEDEGGEDPLMDQALRIVRQHGSASASMLQRRLRIGYNRAARLIEQMEDEGIVGPSDGSRGRPVYLTDEDE